jgi:hypothetical protein
VAELAHDLNSCRMELDAESSSGINVRALLHRSRRPSVAIPLLLLTLLLAGALAASIRYSVNVRRARTVWLPQAATLAEQEKFKEAYSAAVEAEKYIPRDPALAGLWPTISWTATVTSTPPGATVYVRHYGDPGSNWESVGTSPLTRRVPRVDLEWKLTKQGYVTVERASVVGFNNRVIPPQIEVALSEERNAPPGMVRIAKTPRPAILRFPGFEGLPAIALGEYWIDRFEVTNSEFKKFLDAGGYRIRPRA